MRAAIATSTLGLAVRATGLVSPCGRRPGSGSTFVGDQGCETVTARALVVATGTSERTVPFPGWTLPGVIGLAAATILLKAQHVLPGKRIVVGGARPVAGGRGCRNPEGWRRGWPRLLT